MTEQKHMVKMAIDSVMTIQMVHGHVFLYLGK